MQKFQEMIDASSSRTWTLTGKNRLVKVCSPTAANTVHRYQSIKGYVTQEKYLYGLVPAQIERLLGLRPHELGSLAYVFSLDRLPVRGEFEFKFSTAFPDGKAFDFESGSKDQKALADARRDYAEGRNLYEGAATPRSMTPVVQFYPPGSGMVPQWQLIRPVPLGGLIATVTPFAPFARNNGSLKLYTPHNRGPLHAIARRARFEK